MYSDNVIPQLQSGRSGHCLVHIGTATQRYAYSKNIYSVTSISILFLAIKPLLLTLHFVYYFIIYLLKSFDTPLRSNAYRKLHSPASFTIIFFKRTENGWNCVCCASPVTSLPLHPRADNQVI